MLFATFGEAEAHEEGCEARRALTGNPPSPPPEPLQGTPAATPERREAERKRESGLACLRNTCQLTIALEKKAAPVAVAAELAPTADEEPPWLRAVLACAGGTERGVALVGLRAMIGALSSRMSTVARVTQQRLMGGAVVLQVLVIASQPIPTLRSTHGLLCNE